MNADVYFRFKEAWVDALAYSTTFIPGYSDFITTSIIFPCL